MNIRLDLQNIVDAEEMIKESSGDADLEEMAKEELKQAKADKEAYEEKLKILFTKDPNDDKISSWKSIGAAGGDEAALFAGDYVDHVKKYAEGQGWRFEVMELLIMVSVVSKEVVCHGLWSIRLFKTQNMNQGPPCPTVPVTESQGRVHTSTSNRSHHARS